MVRLLIVDDEKLICEGLTVLLGVYEDIRVVGTCGNGLEALRFCRQNPVDVVLMDIRMDKCDGVEGTRLIKEPADQRDGSIDQDRHSNDLPG